MRPAQIRVFDGLRITTDHVNHLQGALASGFHDFRQILGLGEAHAGLCVSVQDNGSVTIQPGVAFDFQGNRLSCDDPLNLELTFAAQDKAKFICLKYEQVEDGAVEGHPTMIWDSCSAFVRDVLPDPKENLVTLARVVKDPDGKLDVRPAAEPPESIQLGVTSIAEVPVPAVTPPTGQAASSVSPAATEQPGTASSVIVPGVPPGPAASLPSAPSLTVPNGSTNVVSTEPSTPSPQGGGVRFRQGVVQLASDAGLGSYLRSVLAPALRKKIGVDSIDLSFPLAQAELVPDIAVSAFSTQCVLLGDLTFSATQDVPQTDYHFECIANGEATATAGGLLQFAACVLHMYPVPPQPGALWSASDLTGRGAAEFAFLKWSNSPDVLRPHLPPDVFAALRLLVQLVPAAQRFQLGVKLVWNGPVSEQSLNSLETQNIGFAWQVLFGWKAVGF